MTIHRPLISALVLSAFSLTTQADTPTPVNNDYITITGFLGTRINEDLTDQESGETVTFSSELTQAISVGWKYARKAEGELLFSNSKQTVSMSGNALQDIDVYVQYLHFGGKILFTYDSPFSTNIGLGVGGTYFYPSDSELDDKLALSGHISGGIRYQLTKQFALRGDLRVYGTVLNSESTLFCGNSNNACYINIDGDYYIQTEIMTGLEYKF